MKNLILILAIAFVSISTNLLSEEEVIWWNVTENLIDPDGSIDPGQIYNAIFTPDDKYIIVSCERRTFLIEAETGKYVRDIKDVAGVIRFSQDGQYIYTYDNRKINFEMEEVVGAFTDKGQKLGRFKRMDVCEKAGVMIGLYENSDFNNWKPEIWIFDLKNYELIEKVGDKNYFYSDLDLAQNGEFFYVITRHIPDPKKITEATYESHIWDVKLRKPKFYSSKGIGHFQTSPNGRWIGSVSLNKVSLFDAQSIEKKWETTQGGGGTLTGVAFSPDSKFIATGTAGSSELLNDIHIWDVESGKLSYRYSNFTKRTLAQTNLIFSNNQKLLMGWMGAGIIVYNSIFTSTRVDPIYFNDTIQLYPNPSSRKISMEIENNFNLSYKLLSQTGNEIDIHSISNLSGNKLEIDIQSLSNGTYYLIISNNGVSKLYKFIKE